MVAVKVLRPGMRSVIDKDLASALLAQKLDADVFMISTAVRKVCLDFDTPNQREIDTMTLADRFSRQRWYLRVFGAAFGIDHQRILRQEGGRHRNRTVEQTARIIAQIEHDAAHLALVLAASRWLLRRPLPLPS